ncbi:type II restriction m6 adenine DNA methyltransferase, Alw26I/Eco31I/Esp3I family [Thalassovita autumnalis]|uniref:site-specific DNA-methyltransferase (adenine-specific) n=1 Tax=Thalassovita autumnalis TaxID=2072972 RepID=A0A0P1FS77_9RHOB|nr:BREX-1 system adenine-specific DNA-methyltransferase PglX [Thalassovita autumnalis]CUH71744.1 type II restriction m6 adenine DNA methyltransferase, Alw26I/Eco31I/Esp3I family [Thalassovita autumnalis]
MDTNALKKFAQAARNLLIDQIASKFDVVLAEGSAARREAPKAVKDLENAIAKADKQQVIEQVAYTWFNRFTALRFMDAGGYTQVRTVSPADGATRPELLSEAMAGNIPDKAPATIQSLLDGRTPSHDPQAEAYRLLLVHTCNQWHGPMPFLFEQIDDYTELLMPEDLLSQSSILAELRRVMTEDACQDVEIIGWLYQFYISEKKDQVFAGLKKNQKITAENIPAATQLFTPHWIVRYLVENSLGRLWLLNNPQSGLAAKMDYYIAPEEPETDFLRITKPEEIRICDPACGSGHMLTYAFDLLHAIYEEEGYEADRIPALILQHNLTGIEIDDRAGALAAFALAMKAAARLGRRRFLRMEAKPDICVLQDVAFTDAEMQDVAAVVGKDLFTDELRETLGQFEQAKNFGSLIVPKLRDPAETLRVVAARDFGGDLLLKEVQERVVAVLRMAEALSPKYHVVVANPPYMGKSNMNPVLQSFASDRFKEAKADLFAMFMERGVSLCARHGMLSMINMQSWMFLSAYEKLRTKLLENSTILTMAHLGERAFDSIGGAVVSTTAFVFQKKRPVGTKGVFVRLVDGQNEAEKSQDLLQAASETDKTNVFTSGSEDFLEVPGALIAYWLSGAFSSNFRTMPRLGEILTSREGLTTGSNDRFLRQWFEVSDDHCRLPKRNVNRAKWHAYLKGGDFRRWSGNTDYVVNWENDGREILSFADENTGRIRSHNYNGKWANLPGVTWSSVSGADFSVRDVPGDFMFDTTGSMGFIEPSDLRHGALALLNSKVSGKYMRVLSPAIRFQPGHALNIPCSEPALRRAEKHASECVEISKSDWDAYETSWDFTTLPLLSPDHRGETLADSYVNLRTHWQSMTDEMQRLEEENNRIFIDAYGLQDELTPEVPIEEITLTCNPAYRYGVKGSEEDRETRLRADTMAEFLSYAVGCMFGRYSLDAPGLILANQGERLEDYLARIPDPSFMPDEDNVIPVLDENWFPDDITERFRLFLRVSFGEAHFRENLRYIEDALGKDIRKYFTKDFYADHVKRYKKRPIYWMVSSPKGTFNALIYMHRYRGDTVSVLLNDYLREFITKLEGERARLEKLADDPTATQGQKTKALKDVAKVAKQIDELNEWERDVIFPLAQQKIEIDLDDGVKANYPKFGTALKKIAGLS